LARTLDDWGLLPIAVLPFAADRVARQLRDLTPARREALSDDGLILMDLCVPSGSDWVEVADRAVNLPGVVDHGLFMVDPKNVIVGTPAGARPMAAS
jgi:ribose 5-phosphate isomerase